jgi:hypothetical protein
VIFVRVDIRTERDRLRVVAHEVAHHSGADEAAALAYEIAAVRRHVPHHPAHLMTEDAADAGDALAQVAR